MDHSKLRADPSLVIQLLGMVHGQRQPSRIAMISGFFLEWPYLSDPLMGGPDDAERLVSRLDGFDCVTLVESAWALAAARTPDEFEPGLKALRYRDCRVEWRERNHYMSQWIERGEAAGRLVRVLPDGWRDLGAPRELSVVDGLPAVAWQPRGVPRSELDRLHGVAHHGDLVCFVSTRDDLDVFHVGLLVVLGPRRLNLRHASRARGQVVDEPLEEFLGRNETPGLMVARSTGIGEEPGGER